MLRVLLLLSLCISKFSLAQTPEKRPIVESHFLTKLLSPVQSKIIKFEPKVVYGRDNRQSILNVKDEQIKRLSRSVGVMISKERFISGDLKHFLFEAYDLKKTIKLCEKERFSQEYSLGDCSGFLINSTHLLTAGHCVVSQDDCENKYWYFNHTTPLQDNLKIESSKLYSCKRLIETYNDGAKDYSLIQLDRDTGLPGLKVNSQYAYTKGRKVFSLGYPLGFSLKYAPQAMIFSELTNFFISNLDVYHGNSGSPIFDQESLEVIGLLSSGSRDFKTNERKGCVETLQCRKKLGGGEQFDCEGEMILKINQVNGISDYLK
jgi:hypothetical protein